jgi:hypothetical protein
MQKDHVQDRPSAQQRDLSGFENGKDVQVACIPIRSHVCSLAELSLLMMVVGPAGAPLGAVAVWMAGEIAAPFEEDGTGVGPLMRGWI